jgi:hypothetical protein
MRRRRSNNEKAAVEEGVYGRRGTIRGPSKNEKAVV